MKNVRWQASLWIGFTVVYFLLAYACLSLFIVRDHPNPTILWLPGGLLLAVFLLTPTKTWWRSALTAGLAGLAALLLHDIPWNLAVPFSLLDLITGYAAAWLVRRICGENFSLQTIEDGITFFLAATFPASLFSASLGTVLLAQILPDQPVYSIWWNWCSGTYLGLILVPPILLTSRDFLLAPEKISYPRVAERLAALGILAVLTYEIFSDHGSGLLSSLPFFFLPFPILIYAAARFGLLYTTWITVFFILETLIIVVQINPTPHILNLPIEQMVWWLKGYLFSAYITAIVLALVVSERRSSGKRLAASEERLSALVREMPVMMLALNDEGHIVSWNQECERVTGYSAGEILHNPDALAVLFRGYPDSAQLLENWLRDGVDFRERELNLFSKSGEEHTIVWSNISTEKPLPGWKIWALGSDITERKLAEQLVLKQTEELQGQQEELTAQNEQLLAQTQELIYQETTLRESEQRLLRSQRMASIGSWELDLPSGIMWASEEAFRIYGLTMTPTQAMPLADVQKLPLNEYRGKLDRALSRLLSENHPYDLEFSIRRENGEIRHIQSKADVQRDEKGRPLKVVGTIQDLTERKSVEQALLESEARYRILFNNVSDAILVLDGDTLKVVDCNETAELLYGYSAGDMLGIDIMDLSAEPEETLRTFKDKLTHIPFRLHKKIDGTVFPAEITARYTAIEGSPVFMITVRDISERIKQDEALRASELRYRTLFEAESDALFLLDGDTAQILDTNRAASTLYGYTYDEFQLMKSTDVSAQPSETRTALDSKMEHVALRWHKKKDGTIFPTEITATNEVIDGRKIHLAAIRDISERVNNEETLKQNNEYLNALYDTMLGLINHLNLDSLLDKIVTRAASLLHSQHGYICLPSNDGSYLTMRWCTGMFASYLGYHLNKGEGLSGRVWETGKADYINGYKEWASRTPTFANSLLKATAAAPLMSGSEVVGIIGVGYTDDSLLFTPAKTEILNRFAHLASIALENAKLFAAAQLEVSERRNAEAKISLLNQELEQRVLERTADLETANRELEAFSYSVSHDLRAPLRSIDGFSQVLIEDYGRDLDETARHNLQRVRAAAQRMSALMDDLLKLSRLTRSEIRRRPVDLSALAEGVIQELREHEPQRNVEIVIQENMNALADERLIQVVLENLLSNAWKFTSKVVQARIEFGIAFVDGESAYYIRDNGAGFNMAYADKLFGAFQRLHTDKEFPGTGIGLATVQRVIHRHKGRVWAVSETGRGATFYFTL